MKEENRTKRYFLNAIMIALFLVSVYIAHITYQYKVVVRGLLAMLLMYLSFFYIAHSGIDLSLDELLLVSKRGKYLIAMSIIPIIAYWATRQIFDLIWFLFDLFK